MRYVIKLQDLSHRNTLYNAAWREVEAQDLPRMGDEILYYGRVYRITHVQWDVVEGVVLAYGEDVGSIEQQPDYIWEDFGLDIFDDEDEGEGQAR